MKHTPGPWRLSGPDEFGDYTVQPPDEPMAIAAVTNGEMRRMGGMSDEHAANALMIAAAPDMFEALELLHQWWKREEEGPAYRFGTNRDTPGNERVWREWFDGNLDLCNSTNEKARAALAKARGES